MEEFKRLPWHVFDVGTNLEEAYALNMSDYQRANPTDVFFSHLMEINPIQLRHTQQGTQNSIVGRESIRATPKQFIDPRTGVEIPSHMCIYSNRDLRTENIFLKNHIHTSNLLQREHVACLNALRSLGKPESELSVEEKKDRVLFELTAVQRCEEKNQFLHKLHSHYLTKIEDRYHKVPPAINHFIVENWKRRFIEMYRQLANNKYHIRTAISLQPSESTSSIKAVKVHQEHLGNVPAMTENDIAYLRQSSSNLKIAYNARKNSHLSPAVRRKVKELVQEHGVDIVVPISTLKVLLGVKKFWTFCMSVKESDAIAAFSSKKEIVLEKPLPPTYLSGNERYKKGAKYLLHSCLNQNALRVFNHSQQTENKTSIETEMIECDSGAQLEVDYKVMSCDEFIKNHRRAETSYENATFTIFDVTGCDNTDDGSETFKFLVPAKQAAYRKGENDAIQFINYCPKIEFQPEYGAEVMSETELISEWCDLYFRPDTKNERVRFDCTEGKVVHRQQHTIIDVERELKTRYGVESQWFLQRLWHVFRILSGFPVGQYLLQSEAKQSNRVRIYENDSAEGVDITEIVKVESFEQSLMDKGQWQPIDDTIVTEIHEKYRILPCTFPHTDYLQEYNPPVKTEDAIYTKAKETKEPMKICPIDDSHEIITRARMKKKMQEKQFKSRQNQKKYRKKNRRRAEMKVMNEAAKAEVEGLKSAKKLLANTMDQYSTLPDSRLRGQGASNSSITVRTRRSLRRTTSTTARKF